MTRTPRQRRSRATVNAIIDAGFIAVARHGEAGATTNHIAEIAGLGVGSVYEYFRNKEAIYEAMQARMVDDAVARIEPLLNEVVQLDIRGAVLRLLQEFEHFLRQHDDRYLKYAQHTLNAGPQLKVEPLIKLLQELVLRYVMAHPQYIRLPNMATMSYIMINGGIFIVLRHLSDPNPPVDFQQLSAGLADMVSAYAESELARAGR
ncbi:MAG: TetR/AcrR family transcriptional regulator [Moraxellaceae bacterium]